MKTIWCAVCAFVFWGGAMNESLSAEPVAAPGSEVVPTASPRSALGFSAAVTLTLVALWLRRQAARR